MRFKLRVIITAILLGIAVFFCFSFASSTHEESMVILKKIVSFGPRPSGSASLERVREYIKQYLFERHVEVCEDSFFSSTPIGKVKFVNLHAFIRSEHPGKKTQRVIDATHYESKKFDDFVFLGANDGASGTAVILSMLNELKSKKYSFDIELVFFDGEESFGPWTEKDSLYGSRHYAKKLKKNKKLDEIGALILLDMVGDKELDIDYDINSSRHLTQLMIQASRNKKIEHIFSERTIMIDDDHIPFIKEGVPAINIIDFNYDSWHTPYDTVDKVSAKSMNDAGTLVLEMLDIVEKKQ